MGEPLFLTPYIEAGDVETARSLARVDATLLEVQKRTMFIKLRGRGEMRWSELNPNSPPNGESEEEEEFMYIKLYKRKGRIVRPDI